MCPFSHTTWRTGERRRTSVPAQLPQAQWPQRHGTTYLQDSEIRLTKSLAGHALTLRSAGKV